MASVLSGCSRGNFHECLRMARLEFAIGQLKGAATEIRSAAKSDPVAAGDGVVSLMERIWPALQGIDTSSGALGAAVFRTVNG